MGLSFPDLRGSAFSFVLLLNMMLAVGLSYMAFIMLRYVPSIHTFWRVFITNGCRLKKAVCQRIDAFELWCWRIKLVHPKGSQSLTFIGRADAEGEAPILSLPDLKN